MITLIDDLITIYGNEEELTLELIDIVFFIAYQTHKDDPEEGYIKPFVKVLEAMIDNNEFQKFKNNIENIGKDEIFELSQLS